MNFGSEFALHDSDDEGEEVREDAPAAGPLSSMAGVLPPPTPPAPPAPPAPLLASRFNFARVRSSFRGNVGLAGAPPPSPLPMPWPVAAGPRAPAGALPPSLAQQQGGAAAAVPPPLLPPPPQEQQRQQLQELQHHHQRRPQNSRGVVQGAVEAGGSIHPKRTSDDRSVPAAAAVGRSAALPPRTWTRKVDTNILNVDMAALSDSAPYATGDPTLCSGCRACLSAVSILAPATAPATGGGDGSGDGAVQEGVYDWTCEYCHEVNRVELDYMEKPVQGQDSLDYVLEAAPAVAAAAAGGKEDGGSKDASAVLFVIDTSGSMCVTTAVEGRLALRGDRTKDMGRLLTSEDARNQLMPGQRRGVTYVSRLQSMQAAIDAQLGIMAKEMPSRHAGLVTFNAEVSLIGDGSGDSRIVAGDRLSDAEALKDVGRAYPLSRPVSEARTRLADRLFALEEGGPTALGPAVVAGLAMIKERGGRGSRLVVCTDGLANVGLGALDNLNTDEEREAAEEFYEEIGRESAENGVAIDVVSVDSDACDLEKLGAMADVSGGSVTRVKASELTSNFAGILANPILASQVSVRVTLHKGLKFRNADVGDGANTLDKDIGNVTRETELNFEYQVRGKGERRAMGITDDGIISSPTVWLQPPATPGDAASAIGASPAPLAPPARPARPAPPSAAATAPSGGAGKAAASAQAFLPFQVQIRYTRLDGTKCLRVLTKTQRVTKSKSDAEKSISMAVVAGHAASSSGRMASKGAYQSSRVSMRAWNNLMFRNQTAETSAMVERYGSAMATLDADVDRARTSEVGNTLDEEDEGGAVDDVIESVTHGRARKSARANNDALSLNAYRQKAATKKAFQPDRK